LTADPARRIAVLIGVGVYGAIAVSACRITRSIRVQGAALGVHRQSGYRQRQGCKNEARHRTPPLLSVRCDDPWTMIAQSSCCLHRRPSPRDMVDVFDLQHVFVESLRSAGHHDLAADYAGLIRRGVLFSSAPTVVDHSRTLPQRDGSARPALAGREEGGE